MTNRARHEVDFIATPQLPPRDALGHKGSFGSVLVIGGCVHGERTMLGGIMLAARGALRVGAGRVPCCGRRQWSGTGSPGPFGSCH